MLYYFSTSTNLKMKANIMVGLIAYTVSVQICFTRKEILEYS